MLRVVLAVDAADGAALLLEASYAVLRNTRWSARSGDGTGSSARAPGIAAGSHDTTSIAAANRSPVDPGAADGTAAAPRPARALPLSPYT
jgi:hypothetical protein